VGKPEDDADALLRPERNRNKVPKMGKLPPDYAERKRVEREKMKRNKRRGK
jgi:hypothetical protein